MERPSTCVPRRQRGCASVRLGIATHPRFRKRRTGPLRRPLTEGVTPVIPLAATSARPALERVQGVGEHARDQVDHDASRRAERAISAWRRNSSRRSIRGGRRDVGARR